MPVSVVGLVLIAEGSALGFRRVFRRNYRLNLDSATLGPQRGDPMRLYINGRSHEYRVGSALRSTGQERLVVMDIGEAQPHSGKAGLLNRIECGPCDGTAGGLAIAPSESASR